MPHKTYPANRLTTALSTAGAALALALAGCFGPANDELTKGVVAGERPVAMEGADQFFGGRVSVKVTLGRGIGRGLKKGHGGDSTYHDYTDTEGKMLVGSPLPPVTLHLIVTNPGSEAITLELIDFVSDLGNFALDPDTLTIAPGQSSEPTPMVSQLGVSSDVIPFKVTLRLGREKETRTFPVKIIPSAADAAAPAAK